MVRRTGVLGALLAMAAALAVAQAVDPPSRVARLNYENGPVSFRPGSTDDWAPASPNYPLTTGDNLWADQGAQAEMHIGSTAIRMSGQTALSFLNLDDRTVQLSVTAGAIHVRLRSLRDDETFEVDTPNVAISLLRAGDYRINSDGDNAVTFVSVLSGEADLTGGGNAFPVHAGQGARIRGTDSISWDLIDVPPPDAFDQWSLSRDRREEQSRSAQYVPREMCGYEDLDQYGAWRNVPPYGWVWTPTAVAPGWAPYRYGHWVWVSPWGWTWVDDAPWGFAPFHYGRWAYAGGAWVWVPGRIVERPVYAPALVAFVGGPNFNISVAVGGGGGGVAWFPLGPGEIYRPAYHVSDVYVRNINVTHVNVTNINVTNVNVTNVRYVNRNVQGAVTAVPQQAFVSARPVAQVARVVPPQEAARAQVVGTTAAVAPRPESVAFLPAGAAVVHPPPQFVQRAVVAKATPPPPPVPFRAQQQALQANRGRPLDPGTLNGLRTNQPPVPHVQVRSAQTAPPVNAPRQTVNPPAGNPQGQRPQPPSAPPANAQPQRPPSFGGQPRNDRPPSAQPNLPPHPAPETRPNPRATPEARPRASERPQQEERRPPPPAERPAPASAGRPASPPAPRSVPPAANPQAHPAPQERRPERPNEKREKPREEKERREKNER